jgi:hypothetical protein
MSMRWLRPVLLAGAAVAVLSGCDTVNSRNAVDTLAEPVPSYGAEPLNGVNGFSPTMNFESLNPEGHWR